VAVSLSPNRPRNVDWRRAAALLYGDWGTSKAYVIGLAFAAAQFSSFPIIIAVCLLTALVGYNYAIVSRNFPDGGGVYSAARHQSRLLAAVGALLLIANFLVTACISAWTAMSYFGLPQQFIPAAAMGVIVVLGIVNSFGPKHSGSMAVAMAVPTVLCVLAILAFSIPHLSTANMHWPQGGFSASWVNFVKVILALSGVEAIASMTGVMKLDPSSSVDKPRVTRTASKALLVVAIEVVVGTVLLGWATLSVSPVLTDTLVAHKEDLLRFLGQHYAAMHLGDPLGALFGWIVGIIFGVLLWNKIYGLSTTWIWASLVLLLAMVGLMNAVAKPYFARVKEACQLRPSGVPRVSDEELAGVLRSSRAHLITAIGVIGTLAILYLMIFKPKL